jgi:hypothetical protein
MPPSVSSSEDRPELHSRVKREAVSMRVLLTAVVTAAVLMTGSAMAGGACGAPTVQLARVAPLVVTGSGFGGHAYVRVSVSWRTTRLVKTVRASSTGAITARFAGSLTVYACRATRIDAVARNGLEATWRPGSKSCLAIAVPVEPTG